MTPAAYFAQWRSRPLSFLVAPHLTASIRAEQASADAEADFKLKINARLALGQALFFVKNF